MTTIERHHALSPTAIAGMLSQPARDDEPLDTRLRTTLVERLQRLSTRRGPRVRLDSFVVEHGAALTSSPFAWSARTARRSLGTRAARLATNGDERDVLTAARHEIERQCDRSLRGLLRPGALGSWLAGASFAVRAECALEAATWASGLLMLLAPERTGIRVGIADAWFDVPGSRTTLHARRDATTPHCEGRRGGILRCSDGAPGPLAVHGLVVDGLVTALSATDALAPSRVLGAWPDAGVILIAEVDPAAIRLAAQLLERTARDRHDAPVPRSELVAA
jgi:hypothetical protein